MRQSWPAARGRHQTGTQNKTEARYETDVLIPQRAAGLVVAWWFESINLRLGDNCFYRPDYLVMMADGTLEIVEVKGFMTDDARVKLSVVKGMYPFPVKIARYVKRAWEIEDA